MKENYIEFENQFRGSRESILERLDQYRGVLAYIKEEYPRAKALDLGCGRGEWLQKCQQYELSAQGIDASSSMIKYCKKEGLNACKGNIFKIMPHLKSNCYSLITAFHIIEHLENDRITKLLYEAERLLKKNGIMIIEMPSIDNIYVSTDSFYLDETHINKIHPKLLIYKLSLHGFKSTELNYINGEPEEKQNHLMRKLFYNVGQDVSIVACKKTTLPKLRGEKGITDSIVKYPEKRVIISEIDFYLEKSIKLLNQVSQQIEEETTKREMQLLIQADQLQAKINQQADQLQAKIDQQADQLQAKINLQTDQLQAKINQQADQLQAKINQQADQLQAEIDQQADQLQAKITELTIKIELTGNMLREQIQSIEKSVILKIEKNAYYTIKVILRKAKKIPSKIKAKIPNQIKSSVKSLIRKLSSKIYRTKAFRNWTTATKQRRIVKGLRLLGGEWIAQTISQAIYEYKQAEANSNPKKVSNNSNLRTTDMLLQKRSNNSKRYNEIKRNLIQGAKR
jgi:O-antigen chain-terminating methyltransferase